MLSSSLIQIDHLDIFMARMKANGRPFCSPPGRPDSNVDQHTLVQIRAHYLGSMAAHSKRSRGLMLDSSGHTSSLEWRDWVEYMASMVDAQL